MAERIRWGILGGAGIAVKAMIPGIAKSRLCEVRAIASRDGAKARAIADRFGIPRAYDSYEALLADPDIDAIYNPLPNHLHVPMTIRALKAGKPVLCEKPVALTAAEAETLVAAQRASGLPVAEAFMVRFHPQWLRVREIVKSGAIGELRAIQTLFTYHLTDPANVRNQAGIGGGALYDVGCYAVNTARFLFGAEPERAVGLFDRDAAFGTDRLTSGMLSFPGGGQLTFTCATQAELTQQVTILGTEGRISVAVPFNPAPDLPTTITVARGLAGGESEEIVLPAADQYALEADAFAALLREGVPFGSDLTDAVRNMRVIDALFRSASTGRIETIEPYNDRI